MPRSLGINKCGWVERIHHTRIYKSTSLALMQVSSSDRASKSRSMVDANTDKLIRFAYFDVLFRQIIRRFKILPLVIVCPLGEHAHVIRKKDTTNRAKVVAEHVRLVQLRLPSVGWLSMVWPMLPHDQVGQHELSVQHDGYRLSQNRTTKVVSAHHSWWLSPRPEYPSPYDQQWKIKTNSNQSVGQSTDGAS